MMARHVDELIAQSVITGLRGTHRGERGERFGYPRDPPDHRRLFRRIVFQEHRLMLKQGSRP